MSDTKPETEQQQLSSRTAEPSVEQQIPSASPVKPEVSSPTSVDSPAIIETTSSTLTIDEGGRPPLASEEDTSSTISNIPAITVTIIDNLTAPTTAASSSNVCLGSHGPEGQTVLATVHQPQFSIVVERQTSVNSNEGNMANANNNNVGFRNTFNGRVPFARMLSAGSGTDRRVSNDNTGGRVAVNLSNNLLTDIFAFMQQARNPNNLFSAERRNLFAQSGRSVSHMPGSSTPPVNHGVGNPSDVVIDVDNMTGPSLRSSNNEIYPISTSSSVASSIRPNSWIQPNSGDEDANNVGRPTMMPNFNYHHHHHHFHNHQPLSTVHHQLLTQQPVQSGQQQNQPSSLGAIASGSGIPLTEPLQQPTTPTNPNPNNGTRSNSISSNNQPSDETTVHEALNQIPEARVMIDTFARYIPLMFILITKLCYDHLDGIIHFLALLMTFSHANWVVRQEISKQAQKRIMVLLRELIFIVLALVVVGFLLERKNIFLSIMFMPDLSEPLSLKSLLFSVCMSDLVLKLLTIIVKIVVTLMPPSVIEYKSRGKIYLMTEALSQLYRSAAPIQPWLIFLFESYSGSEKIVGVILSAVYMVAKSSDLLDRIKFCKWSVIKLLQKTSYGTIPSKEQLQACGGQCPICHDSFNSPVLLECNHIFCELCVGTWFDREQTCPLCRAKIVDDPSYRDGATTFFLQLY
ncbi:E3 ubiquitin-protein ligase RNFT1 [Sabethes cyaneus]|uniref:E3 ubiquitin-protein ligase RNFT1 n=1 Tax=Sabethes cyaneus TaxID=53552 RepID=UPI00237E6585|nr:E3 ubiquitin-protein ligase RNFT1 [Sabethes cyaneus]